MKMKAFSFFSRFLVGLVGAVFAANVMAASEPIEDKDDFGKRFVDCINLGAKNNCLSKVTEKHVDPSFRGGAADLRKAYKFWETNLSECRVYKVHVLDKVVRADLFESRPYIIECADGAFLGAYINLRKVKERWYVFGFSLKDSEEFVFRLLDYPPVLIQD
jgi:hypothetical protein